MKIECAGLLSNTDQRRESSGIALSSLDLALNIVGKYDLFNDHWYAILP